MTTYHITTFGCQMNAYDSELMEGILAAKGWTRAASEPLADVILYNTCVVRGHAEERALSRLSQLKSLKAANPRLIVGVTGCMAQKEAEALIERLPHIDLVLGTRAIPRLSHLLDAIIATGRPQTCVEMLEDSYPAGAVPLRQSKLKGLVNIIYGCNKNCAYCIVPRTRGREVSRPVAAILDEVRGLVETGAREITLIGQNVNSYRSDDGLDFGGLLRAVAAAAAPAWVRYITSHPRDCTDPHLAAVADSPNVCENLHLPAQSGSSAVLRAMRRGYTRERYLDLVGRIRAVVPGASLSTDLIVGFPGETDADYEQTLELVREVRFDAAFMYLYSPRPGTPAAEEFTDQIPLAIKKERLAGLIKIQEAISMEKNRELIGRRVAVLVEDEAPKTPGALLARTRGDKMVIFPGPAEWIGEFKEITIQSGNAHTLQGNAE